MISWSCTVVKPWRFLKMQDEDHQNQLVIGRQFCNLFDTESALNFF